MSIPKLIFIVPYRNRMEHKYFFSLYMSHLLKDISYEIYFSHQSDERPFNRGAVKNIGFLAMKKKYEKDYKKITFIFHDIDIVPFSNIWDYETSSGIVKHFYGFDYALGGIVSILGEDFEKINGFPNYWGWGKEDSILQDRTIKNQLTIDRTRFYPIGSPKVLQLFDGVSRLISQKEPWKSKYDNGSDGLSSLSLVNYSIDLESKKPCDNEIVFPNNNIQIINIHHFLTPESPNDDTFYHYDLRESSSKIFHPENKNISTNAKEWTDIPKIEEPKKKFVIPEHFKTKVISNQKKPPPPPYYRKSRITLGGII